MSDGKQVRNFTVTTESGAVYHLDFREAFWLKEGSRASWERIFSFKVFDRGDVSNWDELEKVPPADEPVIGKSIFVSGGAGWRISTPVVSIVEFDEAPGSAHEVSDRMSRS
ncbi:hypothetical protein ACFVAJ_17450 [Agromyces sp. NPDC057679]|uniref:hypothetical protein n=1 Tax=Agromyces sp. NPDC057679 TaxID=3346207 RepID=UPI0036713089